MDFWDSIKQRVKSWFDPIVTEIPDRLDGSFTGPFLVSNLIFNWKFYLVLIFSKSSIEERIFFLGKGARKIWVGGTEFGRADLIWCDSLFLNFILIPAVLAFLFNVIGPPLNNISTRLKNRAHRLTHGKIGQVEELNEKIKVLWGSECKLYTVIYDAFLLKDHAKEKPPLEFDLIKIFIGKSHFFEASSFGANNSDERRDYDALTSIGLLTKSGMTTKATYSISTKGRFWLELLRQGNWIKVR